jgi:hypothetical protein
MIKSEDNVMPFWLFMNKRGWGTHVWKRLHTLWEKGEGDK